MTVTLAIILLILCTIIILLIIKINELKILYKKLNDSYEKQNNNYLFLKREQIRIKYQNELLKNNIKSSNKRILIGDYNEEALKNAVDIIEKMGFNVDVVTSSNDIIDKIKHNYKCDLIITNNIYKSGCDGPTMLTELKKINGFNIPVVINTISKNEKEYFIDICGFDDYIIKPINEKNIKSILEKFLNNR